MRFTTYLPTNQRLLMTPEQVTTLMQGAITTYVELIQTQSRLDEEACHLALEEMNQVLGAEFDLHQQLNEPLRSFAIPSFGKPK